MKVQAIQNTENVTSSVTEVTTERETEFSSYLKTTNTLEQIFEEAAATYNVPKDLLKAIAKAESDFNPNATSGAGAQGIMQLMPATAKSLGVTDAYDPYQNIMGGAKYISQMLDKYNGDIKLALAAYNAGPGNVAKYGGVPPFKETQNYVVKVLGYMNENVSVPNVSYDVPNSSYDVPNVSNDTPNDSYDAPNVSYDVPETYEDSHYETILDELFSYKDYLGFLEIYTKIQEEEHEKEREEAEEARAKSDSYYSYQEIRYNPAILNLINKTN